MLIGLGALVSLFAHWHDSLLHGALWSAGEGGCGDFLFMVSSLTRHIPLLSCARVSYGSSFLWGAEVGFGPSFAEQRGVWVVASGAGLDGACAGPVAQSFAVCAAGPVAGACGVAGGAQEEAFVEADMAASGEFEEGHVLGFVAGVAT